MTPGPLPTADETRILRGCLDGDPDSWRRFVEAYTPLVRHVIRGTLRRFEAGHRAQELLDDLQQMVFLSLWEGDRRRLRSFEGRRQSSLATWLRVVVANLVIDHLRKKSLPCSPLAEEDPPDGDGPAGVVLADQGPSAQSRLESRQALAFVREELAGMTERERLVVKLRCLDGLSGAQAARVLGISRNNVDQILHRVKKRLRRLGRDKGYL